MKKIKEIKWIKELRNKYYSGISNIFVITGNINDYPVPGYLFMDYLFDNLTNMEFDYVYEINLTTPPPENYNNTIDYVCDFLKKNNSRKAFMITFPEFMFPNIPQYSMSTEDSFNYIKLWSTINSREFIQSDNLIIFVTESRYSINPKFLGANTRSSLIEVPFPDENQRFEFLNYLKKTSKINIEYEVNLEEFAKLTAGLTLVGIEDIYLQGEAVGKLKRNFVIERKKELIHKEYGEVIEVLDSDGYSFDDFAGQEHLKKYHREVIINPMLTGEIDIVPKGLLYTGPPGTGKTHFARCLSGEAGINFVELKMSKILNKWVGESEKRFDKALTCIKSITPVGVFIDEIDQAFSRDENDTNSVGKNLFAMFLTILSDPVNRGKIIWIGACNYPNRIDEALKRTGRFDKKIPFLLPNKKDRIKTMLIYLNKAKYKNSITEKEFEILADKIEGYTQAEIEGIVTKALELVIRGRKKEITFEDLKKATELIVKADNEKIKEMTEIAINECNDLEFMPDEYKKASE